MRHPILRIQDTSLWFSLWFAPQKTNWLLTKWDGGLKELFPKAFSISCSLLSNPFFLKPQSATLNDLAIFSLKAMFCIVQQQLLLKKKKNLCQCGLRSSKISHFISGQYFLIQLFYFNIKECWEKEGLDTWYTAGTLCSFFTQWTAHNICQAGTRAHTHLTRCWGITTTLKTWNISQCIMSIKHIIKKFNPERRN